MEYYARTNDNDCGPARWQKLEEHLRGTAERAGAFAEAFSSGEWGYLAGLWHDLGKYQAAFQEKLMGRSVSVEHSGCGAAFAAAKDQNAGVPLAFVIAGHHAGLANLVGSGERLRSLKERLAKNRHVCDEIDIPDFIVSRGLPDLPLFLDAKSSDPAGETYRAIEFWIRFLFSTLVDADRLDSEAFSNPRIPPVRGGFSSLGELKSGLDAHLATLLADLSDEERDSPVNRMRAEVLKACRAAASSDPGLFSLTVPTGGGKTLSSMSFALDHAVCRDDFRRVIVVIPYTSIIEQNADVYRKALGVGNVVEHHSNLDPMRHRDDRGEDISRRHELACENWDAPVIVTTTVQFFETLFSNHPSRCRKLHNIARSVIVLDEVQTLPPGFLLSILDGLNELVAHYGCSVLLSTATPPALRFRERFPFGLRNVREIMPDSRSLMRSMKRVDYSWPPTDERSVTWPQLAKELHSHPKVLAIVHRRADARELAELLRNEAPEERVFHLSALMCASHRSDVLRDIDSALRDGDTCRVVSTQLVEAGVDIDFPVVYRALGGLESIVQAAGRCNREGKTGRGQVIIFRPPTSPPPGTPRRGAQTTEAFLEKHGGSLDPADPELIDTYFRMLYHKEELDRHNIQRERQAFNFETVGQHFKLIEDGFTRQVVVPYGNACERLDEVERLGPSRERRRSLQPFIVSIYAKAFDMLERRGALIESVEGVFRLSPPYQHLYDGEAYGLVLGDDPMPDPERMVID